MVRQITDYFLIFLHRKDLPTASMSCIIFCSSIAGMMELVDVTDSKSVDGNIVWVRVPLPAPCGDDDFDTRVSRLSSLLFCLKTAENRGLYNTFMKSAAAGWSNSKSVAALFVFGGNRCFIGECSSVSCAGSTSSAKNCAKLMPNALHTASRVGSVGALFLLNIFVTVEWERFASFARR